MVTTGTANDGDSFTESTHNDISPPNTHNVLAVVFTQLRRELAVVEIFIKFWVIPFVLFFGVGFLFLF